VPAAATKNITATAVTWEAERQAILRTMQHHSLDFAALGRQLGVAGSTIRSAVYKRKQPARPRLLAALRNWLHAMQTQTPASTPEVAAPADVPFRGSSVGNGAATSAHAGHASSAA
jgi:hypothetical protein